MKIETTRFGSLEVPEKEVFTFPEGLLGFAEVRTFTLLQNPGGGPFRWLQSMEMPSLAFVVTDPILFFPDYRVGIRKEEMATLGLDDLSGGVVLVILTLNAEPSRVTANLQGPIVVHPETRKGRQIVLNDPAYGTRHPLFTAAAARPAAGNETDKETPDSE